MQAFTLQPLYGSDAGQMAPMLLANFADVAAALQQAATELASGDQAILQSLTGEVNARKAPVHTLRDPQLTHTELRPFLYSGGSQDGASHLTCRKFI